MNPQTKRDRFTRVPNGGTLVFSNDLWQNGDTFSPDSEFDNMAANTTNIYHQPGSESSMSTSTLRTRSSASTTDEALLSKTSPKKNNSCEDSERLERSNKRMKVIFWILITLCVIAVIIYAVIIAVLVITLSRTEEPQPTSSEDCVTKDEMMEFKAIWDPEDKKPVMDMLGEVGFVFDSEKGTYCFRSLQWVPQIMGKIHSNVQESVKYIEEQQDKINQTVNAYTAPNNTGSQGANTNTQESSRQSDSTYAAKAVYAHYFLDTGATYRPRQEDGPLQWVLEHQMLSTRNGIGVSSKNGEFMIRHSGFYFIYTHLAFKDGPANQNQVHRVIRRRGERQRTKLLESVRGRASFLQGVFRLREKDVLTVEASTRALDVSRDRVSYFGTYLLRT